MVRTAEQEIKTVTQTVAQISREVAPLKVAVDHLSKDVDIQTERIERRGGEISQKFQSLDATAAKFSDRLDAMEKSLATRVAQLSKQVDNVSIRQAYPTLGQPKFVPITVVNGKAGQRRGANEKWINIYIDVRSVGEFSSDQIKKLMNELKKAGYTPLIGMFGIGGPYSGGYGNFENANDNTTVFYFHHNSEQMARDVAAIASKTLSIPHVEPRFVDPSTLTKDLSFVIENSGLDLQLYLFHS